ncbi:MAG: acyltransferase [Gemmatimonadota bacterium]
MTVPPPQQRFLFIDGLRGVAAMMVVLFHFNEALSDAVTFPAWIVAVLRHGDLGVDVFFVLSGFVIAFSVRNGVHTPAYLARFALRRSIRLDPPLWATIVLELVLIQLVLALFPEQGTPIPTMGQTLANMTYVQVLLGIPSIVPVFWSLTYEVQFYIVVVASLVGIRWSYQRGLNEQHRRWLANGVGMAALVYSLSIWHGLIAPPLTGLFIERWFQFFLGVVAWLTTASKLAPRMGLAIGALCVLSAALFADSSYRVWSTNVAVATSALIIWVGLTNRMSTMLSGGPIQFLGRVSYSLYLLHLVTGWRFIALMKEVLGPQLSLGVAILVLAGGIAVSIGSAWAMYRLLEAPSMRLARTVRLQGRQDAALAVGA